jgi:drug/metabolite transporter (DMT)-like permease
VTLVAYVACALIWGTTWFAIRANIGEGGYPTFLAASLRFTLAGVILGSIFAFGLARPGPRARREWLALVGGGLLNAAGYALVYKAEERITGGLAAVLYGTAPIMMAIVASATRVERPTAGGVLGALVSLAGIVTIYVDRLDVSAAQAAGVAMILGSVLISTIYNIIMKRHAGAVNPLAATGVFLATTAGALWLVTLAVERRPLPAGPPVGPTIALLYLGVVGSVIAFASYFFLIKRVRLMTLSTLVFIQPVIAMTADALFDPAARELTAKTWAGAAITLAGVILTVLARAPAHR